MIERERKNERQRKRPRPLETNEERKSDRVIQRDKEGEGER